MAIGPSELLNLTQEDEVAVKRFEDEIDKKLIANYEPGNMASINIANISDQIRNRLTFKMKNELAARYQKAGWKASIDGDFLVLDIVSRQDREDTLIPQIPVDEMLQKMHDPGKPVEVKSPKLEPVVDRSDPRNPYERTKLASKPR